MMLGAASHYHLRAALESVYGLALGGLSDEQLDRAARDAGAGGPTYDEAVLERVVDHLPIEESWLFRNEELWRWLHDELVPVLLAEAWEKGTCLRVASIGCSMGQEPFSLAIVMQRQLEAWGVHASSAHERVEVVGYDASASRVAAARKGELNAWSVERSSLDWAQARTHSLGNGRYRMDDSVRAMCRFEVANLLHLAQEPWLAGFRLVLCRHALIYFDPSRASEVVSMLGRSLDPGATLVLGTPEAHLLGVAPNLEPLPHLAAARVRHRGTVASLPAARAARAPASRPRAPAPRPGASVPLTRPRPEVTLVPLASRPAAPPGPPVERGAHRSQAEEHLRAALAHAAAGRHTEALEQARFACVLRPDDLSARLVLAQSLAAIDKEQGRLALLELLESTEAAGEGSLAFTPDLSAEQIALAVRLLLEEAS
ncbi:MAG: CheR family methyltransferase [Myxococcales bacterium]